MSRPLKIFMRGKRVTVLQEILRRMGYQMDEQPGLFGVHTRDAVKAFQKQHNLKPTGMVDDELFKLMQFGQAGIAEPQATDQAEHTDTNQPINQPQLDALIRLLIRKGVITDSELSAEMAKSLPSALY
ncbi:peptidoglycan-binding protein [Mariprofundus erugo]|uniref:Peptidoglycan-binding protein n=1 Tax=Mariprofundus erugo TaxID=2528639 RepID=A0A5R9GY89_9PROT|nr:peptidoglycan-binding domain-containing protein [Mariprofundus erugo]TLS67944.1 peptidoglycan-binding protein [Mariprofundus erugo]